jgi:outer membrane lipoprotein-sorting protein
MLTEFIMTMSKRPQTLHRAAGVSFIALLSLLSLASRSTAQTADELVAKVLAARGGVDKLKAIRSQKVFGKISFGPSAEGPFSVEFERPGKMHMEMNIGGQAIVRVYDGKSAGWVLNPFSPNKDVQPMSAEELAGIADESDFDGPLLEYQSKGNHVEVVGKDEVEGKPVYRLKLTNKNGEVRTYFFDAATYLLTKWEGQRKAEDQVLMVETFFRDYRDVNGLKFAFEIDSDSPGIAQQQKIIIDKIELNPALDEASFGRPIAQIPLAGTPAATTTVSPGLTPGVNSGENPPATPNPAPAQPQTPATPPPTNPPQG